MEEQQSREFASADTATGAQDAAVQERRLRAEIPVEPCCRLQHFQRPTPSHFSPNAPDATRRGDEHVVRGRRCGVRIPAANRSFTLVPPQRDNTVGDAASLTPTNEPAAWTICHIDDVR